MLQLRRTALSFPTLLRVSPCSRKSCPPLHFTRFVDGCTCCMNECAHHIHIHIVEFMGEQIYLAGVDGVECNLGDVVVALSVTTTGETRPVYGMRIREGWIYCFENTGNTGRMYVHASTANFRLSNGAPIDFSVCHFMNLVSFCVAKGNTCPFEGLWRSVVELWQRNWCASK